jgi:hypothetical protein
MNYTMPTKTTDFIPHPFAYSKINRYGEYLSENNILYDKQNIKKYLNEFSKLNFNGLETYYKETQRCNLLRLDFITYKIAELLNDNEQVIYMDLVKIRNIGLQLMLWEILCPDHAEFS